MLEQVAELQQNWRRQNITVLPVSVNFSAATLLQHDFAEKLEHIRLAYGVLAGQIEIEVTEHCFMEQQQALVPILQQIRKKKSFPFVWTILSWQFFSGHVDAVASGLCEAG